MTKMTMMKMKMMMRKRRKKELETFAFPSFPVFHSQWKFCEKKKLSNFHPPLFLFSIFDFSKSSMSFSSTSFASLPPPHYYYLSVNLSKSSTCSLLPFSYFSSFSFPSFSSSSSFFSFKRFSSASSPPSHLPSLSLLSPSSSSSSFSSSFDDIGVHPALRYAFQMQQIWKPTTMQERVIEQIEKGRDVVIAAGTGSGKTLAYLLPLLNRLYCLHDRIEEIQNEQNSLEEEETKDFSEEEGREVGRRKRRNYRKKGMKEMEEATGYFKTFPSRALPSAAVNPAEYLTFSSEDKSPSSAQFLASLKIQTSTSSSSSSSSSSFLRRPSLASMISNPLVSHRPWIILTPTRDLVSQICQMLQSFDVLGRVSIQTLTDIEEFPNSYKANSSSLLPGSSSSGCSYFYPSSSAPSSSVSRFQEISVQQAELPAILSSSRIRWGAVDVVVTTPQKFVEDLHRFSRERLYPSCIIFDEIDALWNDGASKTRVMDIIRYLRPRLPRRSSSSSSSLEDDTLKGKEDKNNPSSHSYHSRQYSSRKDSKSSSSSLPQLPNLVPCQFVFVGATLPSVGLTSPGSMISERFCTANQISTADFQRVKPEIEQKWLSVTGTSFSEKKGKSGRKRGKIKFSSSSSSSSSSPFSSSSLTDSIGTSCSYFDRRVDLLMTLLKKKSVPRTLVFVNNLVTCKVLFSFLQKAEWPVVAFHRGMTAAQRMRSCEEFFEGRAIVMISTDLAARGVDMKAVHHIINFQFPRDVVTYIHRCGRTARLGSMKNTEDVGEEGRGGKKKEEKEEEEEKRNDKCRQRNSSLSREINRKMGRGRKDNKSSSSSSSGDKREIREERRRQGDVSDLRNQLSSGEEENDFTTTTTTSSISSACNVEENKEEEEIRQMFASSAGDFGFVVSNLICPEEDELLVKSVVELQKKDKSLEEGYSRRRLLRTNAKRRVAILEKTEENNFWNFFFTDEMEEKVNKKNEKEEKREKIITLDKNVKIKQNKQTFENSVNLHSSSSSSSSPSSSSFPPSSYSSSFPPSSSSSSFPPSSSSSSFPPSSSASSFPPSSSSASSFPSSSSSSISRRRSDLLISDSEEEEASDEFHFSSDRRMLKEKLENNDNEKKQKNKNISISPSPFHWNQLQRQDDPKNLSSSPKLIQRFHQKHSRGREEMRNRFLLNNFEEKNEENAEDMKL